jgi:hypothetical protein
MTADIDFVGEVPKGDLRSQQEWKPSGPVKFYS